jgi:hypothetical protein
MLGRNLLVVSLLRWVPQPILDVRHEPFGGSQIPYGMVIVLRLTASKNSVANARRSDQPADRGFEFAVERAVFASVLHRLFVSGSDRSYEKWMADYRIAGIEELQLHHFYRAMAWLGEEIASAGADALAPRCIKDLIEERLFERRRDLFSDLSLVFMDTISPSFDGAGGESRGAYGHSKDHRADLKQMILAVVIDGEGRPICTEMLPGNTADAIMLLPVIDRLRERFHIGRVCVVADRGMISAATIAALEKRKLEYVLDACERQRRRPPSRALARCHCYEGCSPGEVRSGCGLATLTDMIGGLPR